MSLFFPVLFVCFYAGLYPSAIYLGLADEDPSDLCDEFTTPGRNNSPPTVEQPDSEIVSIEGVRLGWPLPRWKCSFEFRSDPPEAHEHPTVFAWGVSLTADLVALVLVLGAIRAWWRSQSLGASNRVRPRPKVRAP